MIKRILKQYIKDVAGIDVEVVKPKGDFGDYAVFIKNAEGVFDQIKNQISKIKEVDRIELKGNFINFFLSDAYVQSALETLNFKLETYAGRTVMVEYTDLNPFKKFHIGHLMSNAIGESIARLYETCGAKVIRANYQGDIGLHVAKAIYAHGDYAAGNKAYEEDSKAKAKIEEINQKIYDRSDPEINKLYDEGRKASLEYFEKQYARLGTKFDHYFFESEMGKIGLEIVKKHNDVFVESDGAVVFHGSHTRVFISSKGLPTYEAKELGLNYEKFKKYNPDISLIVTGNEIKDYFKVLMEAMSKVMPDVASKTRHIPHGMLRLPTGKMSSRTGDVITADELIDEVTEKTGNLDIAIGAIKYAILKQGIGHDVIFDREKSVATKGDTGVYLQYTYARLNSIITNAPKPPLIYKRGTEGELEHPTELDIIKHLIEFSEAIREATEKIAPNIVALYCYELANLVNNYYEHIRILSDEDENRKAARLELIKITADTLKRGMEILGIKALERI